MAAGALGKALGDLAGFPTIHGAGWGKNRCDQMCGIVQMSGRLVFFHRRATQLGCTESVPWHDGRPVAQCLDLILAVPQNYQLASC